MPWTEAEHEITACSADMECAALLGIAPGMACLRIERKTWVDDATVTFVRLTCPGECKRLIGRFQPGE